MVVLDCLRICMWPLQTQPLWPPMWKAVSILHWLIPLMHKLRIQRIHYCALWVLPLSFSFLPYILPIPVLLPHILVTLFFQLWKNWCSQFWMLLFHPCSIPHFSSSLTYFYSGTFGVSPRLIGSEWHILAFHSVFGQCISVYLTSPALLFPVLVLLIWSQPIIEPHIYDPLAQILCWSIGLREKSTVRTLNNVERTKVHSNGSCHCSWSSPILVYFGHLSWSTEVRHTLRPIQS